MHGRMKARWKLKIFSLNEVYEFYNYLKEMSKKGKDEPSTKTINKNKDKVIQDLTFGLKNKNKSKVVQQYVKEVTAKV